MEKTGGSVDQSIYRLAPNKTASTIKKEDITPLELRSLQELSDKISNQIGRFPDSVKL